MTPGGGRASLATVGGGLVAATARPVSSGFRCSTAATALALSSRALALSFTAVAVFRRLFDRPPLGALGFGMGRTSCV